MNRFDHREVGRSRRSSSLQRHRLRRRAAPDDETRDLHSDVSRGRSRWPGHRRRREGRRAGYGAANAVDGDLATEWSSAGDGNHIFVAIDLGAERKIAGVAFLTREVPDGSPITRIFAVVADGGKRDGPFLAGTRLDPRVAKVSFTGWHFRFEVVTSTGGNTGAAEVEVFSG